MAIIDATLQGGVVEAEVQAAQVTQQGFDYAQIDEGIRDEVRQSAKSIQALGSAWKSSMVGIGKRLIEVKGMLPHGQFTDWIAAEFEMSDRMARNFMNVARRYEGKTEIISVFSDTVLYLLAAPSTPDEAREELEERAIAGEHIGVATANEVIADHKPPKAVATFAPPREPKAKPEPVSYAPVWELEGKVKEWVDAEMVQGAHDGRTYILILSGLAGQCKNRVIGGWLDQLEMWLLDQSILHRKGDLTQAINNVREHRRQAKAQAEARTVYGPPAEPEPVTPPDLAADEAEAVAIVEAERIEEDSERAERDDTLRISDSQHIDAKRASYERVQELVAEPDPRLAQAQEGMRRKQALLDWMHEHYGALTGRHTLLLPVERAIADAMEPVDDLIAILGGE